MPTAPGFLTAEIIFVPIILKTIFYLLQCGFEKRIGAVPLYCSLEKRLL